MKSKIVLVSLTLVFLSQCIVYDISRSISDSLGSLSTSLQAISNSLVSSSESISNSLKSDKKEQQLYQHNVEIFTEFAIKEKLNSEEYLRGLSRIARKHNLIDWEKDENTYIAIGKGIKNSGISLKEFYAFTETLSNKHIQNLIEMGFVSESK
ncbi:MAG: putative lipoprotein [Leptonema sp. (in: bacteria)]